MVLACSQHSSKIRRLSVLGLSLRKLLQLSWRTCVKCVIKFWQHLDAKCNLGFDLSPGWVGQWVMILGQPQPANDRFILVYQMHIVCTPWAQADFGENSLYMVDPIVLLHVLRACSTPHLLSLVQVSYN